MDVYRSAIQKHVENSSLLARLGDLYLRGGDKAQALAMYEQAGRLDPIDQENQTNLATIYLESGRIDEAERLLKVVVANGDYALAYNALGLAAIQRQNPPGARAYFEKALELDPDLVEAQLNLGLIYRMAGEDTKAKACFQAFLAKASRTQYAQIIPKVKQELAAMR
jgi:tetratricopeptide (TPR) repeat protein